MADKEKKEKVVSALDALVLEYEASGKTLPSPAKAKALKEGYEKAGRAVIEARKALEAAREVESNAAADMVRAFGKRPVRLSTGEVVRPWCRGQCVYYRGQSDPQDIV